MKKHILILLTIFIHSLAIAQRGKDGNKTVSGSAVIINEYTTLTANATIGDVQLTVQSSNLNQFGRFATPLVPGDLIMIIQMQGASLLGGFTVGLNNTTFGFPKDSTWGNITNYNNCGNYQLIQVKAVPNATTIELDCPLRFSFDVTGKTQIVRLPRINNFTINFGATVTCDPWNGTRGGIIAFEVDGNITLNGNISADAKGFRGGAKENFSTLGLNEISCDTAEVGAQKGEGIGGYRSDYDYLGGRFCKGAPANAGGGGNCHNAGGGGGANGGAPANYFAVGVPDISNPNFITAFNLETPGIANIVSSGGGRGGYSASSANVSPLTNAPGTSAWGGDFRGKKGGFGGRPLDYSTGRLFLGGGGGAGDMNENWGGRGGNGGGLILGFCHGNITGSGIVTSNGENGENTTGTSPPLFGAQGQDGAGGGGAGGTIVLNCYGTATPFTCRANGGNGGTQTLFALNNSLKNQAQGPGGGGGGGYIRVSNTTITTSVNGGLNGITNSNSMTNFPCNGATKGATGEVVINNLLPDIIAQNDTICSGDSAILVASAINLQSPVLEWFDASFAGNLLFTGNNYTTPNLTTNTDFYVSQCPLHYRKKVTVLMFTGTTFNVNAGPDQQVCNQITDTLNASLPSGANGGIWSVITGSATVNNPTSPNSSVTNLSAGINQFVWTVSNGCAISSDTVSITNNQQVDVANAGADQQICTNTINLSAIQPTVAIGATWSVISGSSAITSPTLANTPATNLGVGNNTFVWTIPPQNNCPASTDTVVINVLQSSSVADAGNNQSICSNTVNLNALPATIGIGSWAMISGTGIIANVNTPITTVTNLSVGTNQFVWSIVNGNCPTNADTVTITVNAAISIANAGSNTTNCGGSIQLNAQSPLVGTGTWTAINSTASFTNQNLANTQANNLTDGSNTFVWTISGNNCNPSSDTVVIANSLPPSIAQAGSNTSICAGSINLAAVTPTIGTGLWTNLNNSATIQNPTQSNTQVTNLVLGNQQFIYTVSNGTCPPSTDTISIQVNQALIANAGADKITCFDTINLAGTAINGSLQWQSFGVATIQSPTLPSTKVSNLQIGNNLFIVAVSSSLCPTIFDTVNVFRQTPATTSNAGVNQNICSNSTDLLANTPTEGNGLWSIVSGQASIELPNSPTTAVSDLALGTNILQWKITKPGCAPSVSEVQIIVATPSDGVKAMNDTAIVPGTPVTLYATGGTSYLWEPSANLSCDKCDKPIFKGVSDITYYVTITDVNGCKLIDTLNVKIDITKFVELANVFSPNASIPSNREFRVHHSGLKTLEFIIFNEWGEEVFSIKEGESFDKTWDGTYKGAALSSDSFVYILKARYLDNSSELKEGKILLLR